MQAMYASATEKHLVFLLVFQYTSEWFFNTQNNKNLVWINKIHVICSNCTFVIKKIGEQDSETAYWFNRKIQFIPINIYFE